MPALAVRPPLYQVNEKCADSLRNRGDLFCWRHWLVVEGEGGEVGHAHRLDDAIAAIALVLQRRGR